jgi:hypothetical protein
MDNDPKVDRPSTPVVKKVEKVNPFLPHTPALYITDASEEHKVLLNKFCIVPRHFLVVTKGNTLPTCKNELEVSGNVSDALFAPRFPASDGSTDSWRFDGGLGHPDGTPEQ